MRQDPYKDFAERYDLFFEAFGEHSRDIVEFFQSLFARHRVRSVLDCACGTGHDLVMFHRLGMEVFGSDVSEAMLARAESNLRGAGIEIPLGRVDYRDLARYYDRRFDAVCCLSSSILEMPDEAQVVCALGSMRDVLNEGGILVLTQGTTDKQWTAKPRFILAVNRRAFSRLFVIDYGDSGARYNVLDIFHGDERYDFAVWTAHYHIMLLRDDQESLLKRAGFSRIDFYGTYRFDPYDKASSNILISIAIK